MKQFLHVVQHLLLALWVGSMFGFGALFAPVLFRSVPSRDTAGTIAGNILARIDATGLVIAGAMLVITVLQTIESGGRAIDIVSVIATAIMLALVLVSSLSVRQRLQSVRQQMGRPIDELSETEPIRLEYNKYHRLSTRLYMVNLLLGILLIVLAAVR